MSNQTDLFSAGASGEFDYVIVGGGAAGCALAARLSENPDVQVLVLEAGPDDLGIASIEDAANWTGLLGGAFDWGHVYTPTPAVADRTIAIPRGRVLGGSSAINAMLWYRGHASDYDAWEEQGADGWNFATALPYFRKCEDWQEGANAWRGAGGPMRIERSSTPHPVALAMLEGAPSVGIPVIDDANAADNEGACLSNLTMRSGKRWSAARGYLRPAMARSNLTVRTEAEVQDLLFDGRRCIGVRFKSGGDWHEARARREVVLCAGAIASPALLMRSGIGHADGLSALDIAVRCDLPEVGANLQDHPLLMGVNFRARLPLGDARDNGGGSMMNWRSQSHLAAPDVHAFIVQGPHAEPAFAARHGIGPDSFAVSPGLMRTSSKGYLRLKSADPAVPLDIQPNFLTEQADVDALVSAIDVCLDLADTPGFRELTDGPLSPPGRLSRQAKECFVRESCSTFFHTSGTCRMGSDAGAVVDPELRVKGVDGLRVVDASVMPSLISSNTLAPVLMIAERAADLMLGQVAPHTRNVPCASY